jgi:phosphatidylinositol kinase/protein kinase (PI-3  family)
LNISNKLSGGMGLTHQFNCAHRSSSAKAQSAQVAQAIVLTANGSGNVGLNMLNSGLSVEGQVHELIQEALNPVLLAQMWIGWSAYF